MQAEEPQDGTGRRQELEEAESTLEAIRSGQVDAFVIAGSEVVLLERASAPYRTLVEHMQQGAVTLSADGDIVFLNEAFTAMVATPRQRLLDAPLAALVVESDREVLRTLLAAEGVARAELRLRRADGLHVAALATMAKLDGHRMFLFKDLAREKRHEAADERTRKIFGLLAHELRDMLRPVAELARRLKSGEMRDPQARLSALELIERQAERLLALVDDLDRFNPRE